MSAFGTGRRRGRKHILTSKSAKRLIRPFIKRSGRQMMMRLWRSTGLPALDHLRRQAFGKEALGQTYVVPKPAVYDKQAETLLAAASNHLTRVGLLAETEWKVSLAFWTLMLASGVGLITLCAGDKPGLVLLALRSGGLVLAGYLVSCALFVFGFSVNQSQSINTERNRFLYYQSAALYAVALDDPGAHVPIKAKKGGKPLATVDRSQVRLSTVWATKLVSSTMFSLGSWSVAMMVAASRQKAIYSSEIDLYATVNLAIVCVILPSWALMTILFFIRAQRAAR